MSRSNDVYRRRRILLVLIALGSLLAGFSYDAWQYYNRPVEPVVQRDRPEVLSANQQKAIDVLEALEVKGRAPKTGYSREQFSSDWGEVSGCSVRELILQRDLENEVLHDDGCRVISGMLNDPYTGKAINFVRGQTTSQAVQIDHVVAVSDAWQKGAQNLTAAQRYEFYNDPLNLLAVDGPINQKKSDSDAATWLPPNKDYRCRYVARQVAVKQKYKLWVTDGELRTMRQILTTCSDQVLPVVIGNE